jgi:hypothetical protein
MNGLAF